MLFFYVTYSATGNTFIAFDNRQGKMPITESCVWKEIACQHKVDGVLFLENSSEYHFKMIYLNRDGLEVEMCGNGARAMGVFAGEELGIQSTKGNTNLKRQVVFVVPLFRL